MAGEPKLSTVFPGGQAARHGGITVGLGVTHINRTDVVFLSMDDIRVLISSEPSCTLMFANACQPHPARTTRTHQHQIFGVDVRFSDGVNLIVL